MGGAFLTVESNTEQECKSKLKELLDKAHKLGLEDVRAKIRPTKGNDGVWRAVAWVHS